MRRILAVMCVLAMLVSLAACGAKETPEPVVNEFCQQMKAFDYEAMADCVQGAAINEEKAFGEDTPEAVMALMKETAQKITYTVVDTTVEEEKGTVRVDFEYPDLAPAFTATIGEFITQAFGMSIAGASDEEINQLLEKIFIEKIGKAEPTMTQTAVEFACVKTDDGWKIAKVPPEVMNIMMGNGLSALEKMENSAGEK